MMNVGTNETRSIGGDAELLPEILSANAVTALRRVIIVVMSVGGLLAAYNYWFVLGEGDNVYWLTSVVVPFICYVALRQEKVNVALRLFCWVYWLVICWTSFQVEGIRTPALVAVAPLVMLTAWVQGRRAALLMALASFAILIALVVAEYLGWLPSPVKRTAVQFFGTYVQVIAAASVLAVLIAEHLLAISAHDRRISADFARQVIDLDNSERALKALNDNLEQRVLQRTAEYEKANKALDELAQFNKAILMNSPFPMAVYAADGRCVEANYAFSEIQGTTRAGLLEDHNFSIYEPFGLFTDFLEALLNNQLQLREIHDPNLFGRDLWLEYRFVPVEVNGARHVLIQIVDMTARRRHEEELR
jgi:PAS domain S-box-containing protein